MLKLFLRLSLIFAFILAIPIYCFSAEYKVAIVDYDIRAQDENTVAKYLEKKLKESGLSFSKIGQYTGEQDNKIARKILAQLEQENFDLIFTITSDFMILGLHELKKTPWLFTNVNDPKMFGIKDVENPGGNKSGATYYIPIEKQVAFYKQVMGGSIKKLGLIFDYDAKSRKAELQEFRLAAKKFNIPCEIQFIKTEADLPNVTQKLLDNNVDAIVVTSSGKIYQNIDKILPMVTEKKVPIFSVNKKGVALGAVFAFASDYYQMVDECLVPMAKDILKNGLKAGEMPIRSLENPAVYLNLTQAKKLGLNIPKEIVSRSSKTY